MKSWKYFLVQQKTCNETLCSRYFWTFGWKRVINFLAKSEKTVGPTTLVSVHGAKMNSEGTLRLVFPFYTENRHNCWKLIQSWCEAKADLAIYHTCFCMFFFLEYRSAFVLWKSMRLNIFIHFYEPNMSPLLPQRVRATRNHSITSLWICILIIPNHCPQLESFLAD